MSCDLGILVNDAAETVTPPDSKLIQVRGLRGAW
jgi:hypothetical protein